MLKSILDYVLFEHPEAVVTFLLAVSGVVTYLYTWSHDRELQKHQNYMSLEFESIRVFQVCVEHPEIPLYLDGKEIRTDSESHVAEKAYWFICQVLNLFEIIISYRKDHVVPDDVFATWVSWFHELGTSKRFDRFWIDEDLWSHYKGELQQIMNLATGLARKRPEDFDSVESRYEDELQTFHERVADIMKDSSIKEHFYKRRATQHMGAPQ